MQSNWDKTRHRMTLQSWFETIDFSKLNIAPPDDPDEDDDEEDDDEEEEDTNDDDATAPLPEKLDDMIATLQTINPAVTRAEAAHFIMHASHGRALGTAHGGDHQSQKGKFHGRTYQ